MAGSAQKLKSVAEAKCEFRLAAESLSVGGLIRRHPLRYASLAFCAGMLLANNPKLRSFLLRKVTTSYLFALPFLLDEERFPPIEK
ncbi:MAG: hypothetical protein WD002_15190 [Pseudomonadales bacterium]